MKLLQLFCDGVLFVLSLFHSSSFFATVYKTGEYIRASAAGRVTKLH